MLACSISHSTFFHPHNALDYDQELFFQSCYLLARHLLALPLLALLSGCGFADRGIPAFL